MKTIKLILVLALAMASLNSCDFFRKIAGRPTSEYLETKKALIDAENERHQRRLEMAQSQNKELQDSLAAIDAAKAKSEASESDKPQPKAEVKSAKPQQKAVVESAKPQPKAEVKGNTKADSKSQPKESQSKQSQSQNKTKAKPNAQSQIIIASRQLKPDSRSELSYRYYVIVGAFSKQENAEKALAKSHLAGYNGRYIYYENGYIAIGTCPTNDLEQAKKSVVEIRNSKFCPEAWILEVK